MALEDEFVLAEKKINKLLVAYKKNSEDYKTIGMLDENDALKIIDGSVKIIRKQLEIITNDYDLNKQQNARINNFLDKIRKKLNDEVLNEDILVHGYGIYEDKYGIVKEKTMDEAYHDFICKSKEKLNSISIQKTRLSNLYSRRVIEKWKYWLPIIISILSFIVSAMALCAGGSK